MSKKKIAALIMSAALAVGVIGGSLAYFSSSDTEQNKFTTIGDVDDGGSDIDIVEDFPKEGVKDVQPGDTVSKKVQVKNIDKYAQLMRVHFTVELLDGEGNYTDKIEVENGKDGAVGDVIDAAKLESYLTYNWAEGTVTNTLEGAAPNQWFRADPSNEKDSYYYYLGFVSPDKCTAQLLNSVKLSLDAPNAYKGINYRVNVIADGVQAKNGAFKESFNNPTMSDQLITSLTVAEGADGSTEKIDGLN